MKSLSFKAAVQFIAAAIFMLVPTMASAQGTNIVKMVLVDSDTEEPVPFATVSLTKKDAKEAYKYVLSNDRGEVLLEGVKKGAYTLKAEMMGYKEYVTSITKEDGKQVDLGQIRMAPDARLLDAASVSAVGNPVVVKKDTIEYNASSFKTTDNDMLENLLKKLPGVEVAADGSVTANGQTIKKITID